MNEVRNAALNYEPILHQSDSNASHTLTFSSDKQNLGAKSTGQSTSRNLLKAFAEDSSQQSIMDSSTSSSNCMAENLHSHSKLKRQLRSNVSKFKDVFLEREVFDLFRNDYLELTPPSWPQRMEDDSKFKVCNQFGNKSCTIKHVSCPFK